MADTDVVILGGGLAGIACARHLAAAGVSFQLLEASDTLGGRVRTDLVDGFLLDRGFQVLLTAYPETQRMLSYSALRLRHFYPGALVYCDGRPRKVSDPWRRPLDSLGSLFASVGTLSDKVRVGELRKELLELSEADLALRPEVTTLDYLRHYGFSETMIQRFFRPFFGGIYLERELRTSSRMFEFVFRLFSIGNTSLPEAGMGAIPAQLAAPLNAASIRLCARALSVRDGVITYQQDGATSSLSARAVVIATDAPSAAALLQSAGAFVPLPASRAVTCLYFAADHPPVQDPILVLDGDGQGPVNNFAVLNLIQPSYAPSGAALLSASVLAEHDNPDDAALVASVRRHLSSWFGARAQRWPLLRMYRIPHALPEQAPPALSHLERPVRLRPGLYLCGDHRDTSSIHGAMLSGRRAAAALIQDL